MYHLYLSKLKCNLFLRESITRIATLRDIDRWLFRRTYHDMETGLWSIEEVLQVKDLARMVNSPHSKKGPYLGIKWLVLFVTRWMGILTAMVTGYRMSSEKESNTGFRSV